MWTDDERLAFKLRIQGLWPARRGEDRSVILGLWIDQLEGYPVDVVLKALNQSRAVGCKRIPEAKDLRLLCEGITGRAARSKGVRSGVCERLRDIALSGRRIFTSPKTGSKWLITIDGVILLRSSTPLGAPSMAIPYGAMDQSHLEAILADNESHISRQDQEITWHEFVRSGGIKTTIEAIEARGESATWLRAREQAWSESASVPF